MENNKNKKSVKFQGDVLNFYDFIQVFVFTRNHHLNYQKSRDNKMFVCKVSKNVKSKLKHIENSKTRGQTV